jgi:hypothetical protein
MGDLPMTVNLFGDDSAVHQLATVSGSIDVGYTFELVPV